MAWFCKCLEVDWKWTTSRYFNTNSYQWNQWKGLASIPYSMKNLQYEKFLMNNIAFGFNMRLLKYNFLLFLVVF